MHIALFGGSFDPPHLGHATVAKVLVEHKIADEVWFVPVKQHPLGKHVSSDSHRLAMLKLMCADLKRVRIEEFELTQAGPSYSLQTLRALSKQHPEHTFSWVIGSDYLESFHKWWQYQALLLEFPVLVYPRAEYPLEPLLPGMTLLHQVPTIKASSTTARQRLQSGESTVGLVTPEIESYSREHHLYLEP